jgi:parallel beta-helix repeat protein
MNRIIIVLLFVVGYQSAFGQGALYPTASPAPTMKTLQQIEPRTPISALPATITASGSYYVTTNLTCTACTNGQSGITISTGNVSIDLSGFALQGVTGSSNGISSSGILNNCIVRNGTVSGWGGAGISLSHFTGGLVLDCSSSGNSADGIDVGDFCVVRDCSALRNGFVGISGSECTVSDCNASENGTDGISVGSSTVSGCTVAFNGNIGGAGIDAPGSTVSGCAAYSNSRQGINGADGSTVSGCTVSGNGLDGILVNSFCYVLNNTATGNSGTPTFQGGIHATSNGNRIDSNHSFNNSPDGILVDTNATANIVIRNTSASNGGFNYRVPGIPTQLPAGANIVGSVQNDATNSHVNAWSNFQY